MSDPIPSGGATVIVGIPCYNRPETLERAIRSVLAQTY